MRTVLLGGAIGLGALALLGLASVLPPALADEEPGRTLLSSASELWPPAFDPGTLRKWDYFVEPGVDVEPLAESTIRKIAYGRTSFVRVVQTATGIYSSDGLASPHVAYPGIVKQRRPAPMGLWVWNAASGWTAALPLAAGSFVELEDFGDATLLTTRDGACVVRPDSLSC